MNNDTPRTVISVILSFLMMICLVLLGLIISLDVTIFQVHFITKRMNDRYYNSVMTSLTNQLQEKIAPPSGFPEEVFEGLFTRSTIETDSKASVQAVLANADYTLNTAALHDKLIKRFTEYAQQNQLKLTDANLESLAQICIDEYERQISVPFLKSFASVRITFLRYFPYALLGISTFLIVVLVFLFRLHPYKHRAVRYSIYSLFASALMLIPLPIWILIQGSYAKINISPDHMRFLFVSVTRTTLLAVLATGWLLAVIAGGCLPLVRYMRNELIRETNDKR